MYKPKTQYHSFANRLGILRMALASIAPDRYLESYYKNAPISDWEEIYQKDKKLIPFYFKDCRIGGSNFFDTDKFYKEAEKRIKGIESVDPPMVVQEKSTTISQFDFDLAMATFIISAVYDHMAFSFSDKKDVISIFHKLLEKSLKNRCPSMSDEDLKSFCLLFIDKYKKQIEDYVELMGYDDIPF